MNHFDCEDWKCNLRRVPRRAASRLRGGCGLRHAGAGWESESLCGLNCFDAWFNLSPCMRLWLFWFSMVQHLFLFVGCCPSWVRPYFHFWQGDALFIGCDVFGSAFVCFWVCAHWRHLLRMICFMNEMHIAWAFWDKGGCLRAFFAGPLWYPIGSKFVDIRDWFGASISWCCHFFIFLNTFCVLLSYVLCICWHVEIFMTNFGFLLSIQICFPGGGMSSCGARTVTCKRKTCFSLMLSMLIWWIV